jgi:hypothetical protein
MEGLPAMASAIMLPTSAMMRKVQRNCHSVRDWFLESVDKRVAHTWRPRRPRSTTLETMMFVVFQLFALAQRLMEGLIGDCDECMIRGRRAVSSLVLLNQMQVQVQVDEWDCGLWREDGRRSSRKGSCRCSEIRAQLRHTRC